MPNTHMLDIKLSKWIIYIYIYKAFINKRNKNNKEERELAKWENLLAEELSEKERRAEWRRKKTEANNDKISKEQTKMPCEGKFEATLIDVKVEKGREIEEK